MIWGVNVYGNNIEMAVIENEELHCSARTRFKRRSCNTIFEEKIFPVPAKSVATVTLSMVSNDVKIELTDLNGKVLWQSKKITDKNTHIPVSNLAKGIYLVIITDKEHNKVLKLIKD